MNKTQAKIQELTHEVSELIEKVEVVLSHDDDRLQHFNLLTETFKFSMHNELWDKALAVTTEVRDFLKELEDSTFTIDGMTFHIGE